VLFIKAEEKCERKLFFYTNNGIAVVITVELNHEIIEFNRAM